MFEIFVEKFGGASVNSAEAIRNVASIILSEKKKRLIVVSAMGKTTNSLELVLNSFVEKKTIDESIIENSKNYHKEIINNLFPKGNEYLETYIENTYKEIEEKLLSYNIDKNYDKNYDSIVSYGEIIGTTIISKYFEEIGLEHSFVLATNHIKTNNSYRRAKVLWGDTQKNITKSILTIFESVDTIITQGFIGGGENNETTTLGREGSDFSAAVFAYCLRAKSVTIWKDVPGLLNADPKYFEDTRKFEQVPYSEAIELSYYGASIIHPKTIKPLENLSIPLYVKSFLSPKDEGTRIDCCSNTKPLMPSYIFKDNQTLLSIFPKDFSFVVEENLSNIFALFARYGIKINLMQNSALSYSVCFDPIKDDLLQRLITELSVSYSVKYNRNLRLITIRRYTEDAIRNLIKGKKLIIEQRSRLTAQFLVKL
ncbi:MAG: aspartate kinase [Bacteroidales bacterium]|jgi:aspartate kinase|nr:aspartate kinase [Bacteroidales bacterium]MDD4703417.1 aspartate kinase [Bacteroidales bacterium]MDX9798028.1 aspartate kinase [Bacteroidales bacterium]